MLQVIKMAYAWLSLMLLLLLSADEQSTWVVVAYEGDGSISQDDVIRFVLSMQSKHADGAWRYRHRQPSIMFAEGRDPNSVHDDEDIDKTLYGLGRRLVT